MIGIVVRWVLTGLVVAGLCFLFTACSTIGLDKKDFENRVVFTPGCDRGFLASLYMRFGLTSEIDSKDVAALCPRAAQPASAPK